MNGNFSGDIIANRNLQQGGRTPIELGGATTPILSRNAVFNNVSPEENIPCAVFVTTLALEFLAVERFLGNTSEQMHPDKTVYRKGIYRCEDSIWQIYIVEASIGGAADEARRAIEFLSPDVIVSIGIASGIQDVRVGDVIASTRIYKYGLGTDSEFFQIQPNLSKPTYNLEQRARDIARKWLKQADDNSSCPNAILAPIISGEPINKSKRRQIVRSIKNKYSDAKAFDTEGFSFLETVQRNQELSTIVIRGISDLLDSTAEVNGSREIAARNASTFAFEMLARLRGGNSNSEINSKKVYPSEEIPDINRSENIISIVINAHNSEEYGFSIICGRSRVEILGRVQQSTLDLSIALETPQSADRMTGSFDHYNHLLQDEIDRCVVKLVLEKLSKIIDLNNDEIILAIFDNTKLCIPWELLKIRRDGELFPIGILLTTIHSFHFTQDFNYKLHCCKGGILAYTNDLNHRLEDLYDCKLLSCFCEFIKQIHSCESQYGLILIDGFSIQEAITYNPTSTLILSQLQNQASLVIINGQLNFDRAIPLPHQIFIKLLHTSGAKGIITSLQLVQSGVGQEIINNLFDLFRTPEINSNLSIPVILKHIRRAAFSQFQESPYDDQTCELYLASFQYIYYGSPYVTLELV